jgi:hypothetical protein
MNFDCKKLNELFNVDGVDSLEVEITGNSYMHGEMNPFYGKKHTAETKDLIREKIFLLCENEKFKKSRINYGEKNGMYGSNRLAEKNPMYGKKHTDESKQKMSMNAKERYKNMPHPNFGRKMTNSQKLTISQNNSKTIHLKDPLGNVVEITNITKYAKEHGLNPTMLSRVFDGSCKNHKGYVKT